MDVIVKTESKNSKLIKLLLKIAITAICLWYVSGKIDFAKAGMVLKNVNWFYISLALLAFVFSKWISAIRINIYFKNISIKLTHWQNVKLYWLGMFYNLFLPGSITGDAYKVILLTRQFAVPYKKTTAAVLLDRISGLLALSLIMGGYGIIVLKNQLHIALLIGCSIAAILALYLIIKKFFPDFFPGFWPTFAWGFIVQLSLVACVYLILKSLNIETRQPDYIFIFLIAAVAGILPITVGAGLGVREFVFVEGAKYFGLEPNISIVVSLLFYVITLFVSVFGVIFVFKSPLVTEKNKDS
jgi:uncharacterized membrane protein YbhN (UPF0104 family)